jgi:hypothetical protein
MTTSMKVVIAAAAAVVPIGATMHLAREIALSVQQTEAQMTWQQHAAAQREKAGRDARSPRQQAEHDRRAALAERALRAVPQRTAPADAKRPYLHGKALVWDVAKKAQGIPDVELPPDLRLFGGTETVSEAAHGLLALAGASPPCPAACLVGVAWLQTVADPPLTVFLILEREHRLVRTYHEVREEMVSGSREPVPRAPRVRLVDSLEPIPGYRVDLIVAVVYLPTGKFAGTFRVPGADPPPQISRPPRNAAPEIGPTVPALVQWLVNCERSGAGL